MTIPQEQFDDLLSRTALAALFYSPEIVVDDAAYDIKAVDRMDGIEWQSARAAGECDVSNLPSVAATASCRRFLEEETISKARRARAVLSLVCGYAVRVRASLVA